ncbi:MAG: M36 family metallopeptidase [Acidobacteriota bacterium]
MIVASLRRKASKLLIAITAFLFLTAYLPVSATVPDWTQRNETEASAFQPLAAFDARHAKARTASPAEVEQKKRALRVESAARDGLTLRWNDLADAPHTLLSFSAPLTASSSDDALAIAKRFAIENAALFDITQDQLAAARLSARADEPEFTKVVLEQRAAGIRVFESDMMFVIDSQGRVLMQSGCFTPASAFPANRTPALTAEQALGRAARICEIDIASPVSAETEELPSRERVIFSSDDLDSRTEASLVYFPLSRSEARLAWQVLLYGASAIDSYLAVIDAQSGKALLRDSLTYSFAAPQGRVFTKENPPLSGDRQMVALEGDATASPEGWVANNRTEGNNCQTFYNPNLTGGETIQAVGGNFDFPLDLAPTSSPLNSSQASATNLFYWVNQCHDRFYALGFTEAWRNFQVNNFSRGGRGNDPVRSETLRGAALDPTQTNQLVRNNAFFSFALEGSQPLLAMLMWTPTINGQTQLLDSSYDAGVIIHEYTHGVSIRLSGTDTSFGLRSLQGGGMGEGWSDFFGASFLDDGSAPLDAPRAVGAYVTNQPVRGVRNYPYTPRADINPLTFGDIRYSSAVHAQGTVWCTILWGLRQDFIARYGFEVGRQRTEKLVIDGLKLLPLTPLFTDARDAIIMANRTINGGADEDLIWRAFARRGLGFSAVTGLATGSATFRIPAIEGYDVLPSATSGSLLINEKSPALAVAGEPLPIVVADKDMNGAGTVDVTATNLRTGQAITLQLTEQSAGGRFAGSLRVLLPGQDGGPGVALTAQPGDEISITYANARNDAGAQEILEARTLAARRITVYETDFERGISDWFLPTNSDGAPNRWRLTERRSVSATHGLYFGKQKKNRSFTPLASHGVAVPPQIDLRNLVKPSIELDYFFDGSPGGPNADGLFSGPDIMNLFVFNVRSSSAEPSLVVTVDFRPPAEAFRRVAFELRFIENWRTGINLSFLASSADEGRKKYEGFYIDNIRVTAASTQ